MSGVEFKVYINSNIDRRPNDTTDNWETYFEGQGVPINGKVQISVSEIEFPNVAPTFPFYTSRLYYVRDVGGADELKYIEIDFNKIYRTIDNVVDELNLKFQSNGDIIEVSNNTDYNKLSITNNTPEPIRIVSSSIYRDLTDLGVSNTINERLGFTQNLTNEVLQPLGGIITASSSIRMLRSHCYYLTLQEINDHPVIPSNNFPDGKNRNVICRITASNFGTLSQLYFPQSFTYELQQSNLRRLRFQVLDDEYQAVDLEEHPVSFSLELKAVV